VPISVAIWVCHTFGWGLLGLLAYAVEVADERDRRGSGRLAAFFKGGLHCIPLALPFLLMLVWRSGAVAGGNGDWFNWDAKGRWMIGILRERWELWDKAGAILLIALPMLAILPLGFRMRHATVLAVLFMLLIFTLLPRILLGSAYADMRLAPYMVAVAVLGVRPKGWTERYSGVLAAAGLLFFAARLAVTTHTFIDIDRVWRGQLAALDQVRPGSRVLVQASVPCARAWRSDRIEHIGSFAIVRRDAFTNDQWAMPGAQLVTIRYFGGAPHFVGDPSQMMRPWGCISWRETTLAWTMKRLPAGAFDYLWMIDLPQPSWPKDPRLIPVWTGPGRGILYRFAGSATRARETPNGSAARPTR
jgi:hypothetical protein